MKIAIRNGRVIDPASGRDEITDVRIAAGRIVGIGPVPADFDADRVVAATGCIVAPGLVDLAARLRAHPQLEVIESDVLALDWRALAARLGGRADNTKLRVVGNLPYNISSPILFGLLAVADLVQDQHFMLQKEVVDRMVAPPSGSDYGRLSVMLQWRYEMEQVLWVGPESFDPPPRVDSAVVRMRPLEHPPQVDAALLSELVQVAFSQRRKLMRHTLGPWLEQRGCQRPFDLQRRAQEVPVAEYVALAQSLA
jgi:16S rRNA (adenine1518-N6/adenine1519-N6)-dimethyltransferase